jgi:hypothetical protein
MKPIVFAAFGAAALLLAACGERPQIVDYKQGTYQGKKDTKPYEGKLFNNDKQQWETTIKTRNQNQNEYKRTG